MLTYYIPRDDMECIATLEPSRSPRPTITPPMTSTPKPTPQFIHINEDNCSIGIRCEKVIEKERSIHIFINISTFNNLDTTEDDGVTIYLNNCCLTCDNTKFNNCQVKKGCGGRIFIENHLKLKNNFTLTSLNFDGCKAYNGDAIFIYGVSTKVSLTINSCLFANIVLLSNADQDDQF